MKGKADSEGLWSGGRVPVEVKDFTACSSGGCCWCRGAGSRSTRSRSKGEGGGVGEELEGDGALEPAVVGETHDVAVGLKYKFVHLQLLLGGEDRGGWFGRCSFLCRFRGRGRRGNRRSGGAGSGGEQTPRGLLEQLQGSEGIAVLRRAEPF